LFPGFAVWRRFDRMAGTPSFGVGGAV